MLVTGGGKYENKLLEQQEEILMSSFAVLGIYLFKTSVFKLKTVNRMKK